MATTASFLFLVSWARGAFAAMENPVSSFFFEFPPVALAGRMVNCYYQTTPRCAWCSQPLGQRWLKRYKFQATSSWVSPLWMPCPCGKGNHRSLTLSPVRGGRKKFYGRRNALTASAAYPASLGAAIIAAWGQAKRLTSSQAQGTKPRKRSAAEAFKGHKAPEHKPNRANWLQSKDRKSSFFHAPQNIRAPKQKANRAHERYRSQVQGRKALHTDWKDQSRRSWTEIKDQCASLRKGQDQCASDSPQPYHAWKDQSSDSGRGRGSQATGRKALAHAHTPDRSWKDQQTSVSSHKDTMEGALTTKTRPSWKLQV